MNTLSIRSKLFIAIFLACALAVLSGAALFHFRTQQAFQEYTRTLDKQYLDSLASELENFYSQHNSWETLKDYRVWRRLQRASGRQARENNAPPPRPNDSGLRPPRDHSTAFRTVVYDTDNNLVQGRLRDLPPELRQTLKQDNKIIGYIGLYPRQVSNGTEEDARFLGEQHKTLIMVGFLTLISSFVIAWLLSRQLVKPIQTLRQSSSELASGNYATRIKVQNRDELGLLSEDFNRLAETLQEHEHSRKQWIMDIAHELRTPLSILRGEIEAIQDGISEADPDTIQSLHQETLHLQRLVEDLYTLSVSDSGSLTYHKTRLDISGLLSDTLSQFETQLKDKQLSVTTNISGNVNLSGDAQRLQQLFQNLLRNSLRYTDSPGQIHISLSHDKDRIKITFEDTAPGVPDDALPRLFERLYRVESSRNRATGGAGIGLSICHNIVQAHDGNISAAHSALGGLKIIITLPQTAS
ncbi:MAG: ATP-binding protein [Thiolinea sp.]